MCERVLYNVNFFLCFGWVASTKIKHLTLFLFKRLLTFLLTVCVALVMPHDFPTTLAFGKKKRSKFHSFSARALNVTTPKQRKSLQLHSRCPHVLQQREEVEEESKMKRLLPHPPVQTLPNHSWKRPARRARAVRRDKE